MVEVTGRNIAALLNPRPVILVTCCDSTDTPNVMTAVWHTPISREPPMVGISIGTTRHSHLLIDNTGEFVLNIVGQAFEDAANICGNCSGATTDKITQAGLRLQKSHSVRPPRIAGALAYLECRVVKKLPFGDHSFFVASVLYAEVHEGCSAGDWDQLFDKVLLCRQRDQFGRCEPLLRGDTASSSKCIANCESSQTGKSTEIGVNSGTSAEEDALEYSLKAGNWDCVSRRALPATRVLRLSVTDRCNFHCRYCMPAEGVPHVLHNDLLSLEQLAEMVAWLSPYTKIERVKLTGGEPLVRRGLERLIADLSALPNVREISLTTNGSLLARNASGLKAAGLARVNVSLDSLDPARFVELTRGARLQDTLDGIEAAIQAELVPLKLNAVLRGSSWKKDVPMLLDFAGQRGLEPRFIELMRTGTEREWCDAEFVAVSEVREWLQARTPLIAKPTPACVPARQTQIQWAGTVFNVGWIAPRSHPFCGACERIRLDARGRLRRCLMDPTTLDLVRLRQLSGEEAINELYRYIEGKLAPDGMDSEYAMSQIGG